MILLQNPTLPNPTDPVEIDRAIQDLQVKLSTNLPWLTQAYPRAYPQIESTQKAQPSFVFPAIYLGKSNNDYKYLNAAPDNDKKGQCFFLVDTETVNDFVRGEHNIMSYSLSIVFTANLKLVNDATLATEIFQANLIKEVREVLTRDITLTPYDLKINETKLLFRDVYKEFQLQNAAVLEKAPFTHFRIECDLVLQEECGTQILNRCEAILQNLTSEDLLDCILPTYVFSQTDTQNALSAQQILDLKNWLLPQYDFGDAYWQNLLTYQQDIDLTFYLLPLVDFTDPLIQAILTAQQKTDIMAWLFPFLDFTNPTTQALVTPQQQSDIQAWLCPVPQRFSTIFDGINEYVQLPYSASHELERTNSSTIDVWIKISSYSIGTIIGKFDFAGTRRGWSVWTINNGQIVFELASNESTGNTVTTITIAQVPLNTWTRVTIVYTGTSTAAGVKMFLNKVLSPFTIYQNALTGTTVDATNRVSFGGFNPGYFAGRIFEPMVYKNRALTDLEVSALPTYSDSPQYQSDLVVWCGLGQGSIYGITDRVYPDKTSIISGAQSFLMGNGDISSDIPPL